MIPFPFNENRFSFFVADYLLVGQLCTNPKSDRSLLRIYPTTLHEHNMCDNRPSWPTPDYIKVVKVNFPWPVIRLGFFSYFWQGILLISLRPHKIQPRGWKKKYKLTNTDLGQLQVQVREFMTLCLLDYRGRVFCAKLLQKPQGMPTHLWLSSFTASFCWPSFPRTAISSRPSSSALLCRLTLAVFLCQLTLFLLTDIPFHFPFRSRGRSRR